ncbi:MAG TPA: metallophosphoesterase family protein [Verrucomicrobiae bacterium]|nr:metallophosphoesterase family protein [Verrucomicrobiae bacterium]
MRTLAIGDIHGCHETLVTLLNQVRPSSEDTIIFLGDYIDRGPASRQVIEELLQLRKSCASIFLRGNHEAMILEARADPLKENLWRSYGGFETLQSYSAEYRQDLKSAMPDSHWEFLENTVRFHETATHIFVHACLDPGLDMADQPDWLLFWEFFDRLQNEHKSGKRVICGHAPQRSGEINDKGYAACIDTGAVIGGWLTCLDSGSGQFWQANQKGNTRDGVLPSLRR